MSISRWLHYLLAFTHRQRDVDIITRSISHSVWIEKLVFSFGNKNLQYMKCTVLHNSVYIYTGKLICSLVLSLLPEFDCVALFLCFVLAWCVSVYVPVTGMSQLRVLYITPPVPPSFFHSSKSSSFFEVSRVSRCMRWGRSETRRDQGNV